MFTLLSNPSIDTLFRESIDAFASLDEVVGKIETALGRLKHYYPQTTSPKIQTVVTGLYKDLFISNEHIIQSELAVALQCMNRYNDVV